jgi:hypothetical protein
MSALRLLAGLVAASLASAAIAEEPQIPAEQAALLAREGETAKLLYAYDRAAWVTTDALRAAVPKDRLTQVRGWVVEPREGGTLEATYFGLNGAVPYAVFVGTVSNGAVAAQRLVPADAPEPLDAAGVRMAAALLAARSTQHRPCTPAPFNTVILPPGEDGRIQVYLLSAQTETAVIPMGGHFRLTYDADGRLVGDRPFTRACLNMPAPGSDPAQPKGAEPAALYLTHLLDPAPTEIHAFLSLTTRLPIFVGTQPNSVWRVDGTRITRMALPDKRP